MRTLIVVFVVMAPALSVAAQEEPAQPSAPAASGASETDVPPAASAADIVARIGSLAGRPDAPRLVGDLLAHARLSLRRAQHLARESKPEASERALQIARAAVTLASRRYALELERAALRAATRRAVAAQERGAAARQALRHALRQRAELSRETSQ